MRINDTIERALTIGKETAVHANALAEALQRVSRSTKMAWSTGVPAEALANAVPYMQAFGHTVLAWMWLEVELASLSEGVSNAGRRHAATYFFNYELPKISAWLNVVEARDMTCANMAEDSF
jgi:butyryl-CoA dehydrogenase